MFCRGKRLYARQLWNLLQLFFFLPPNVAFVFFFFLFQMELFKSMTGRRFFFSCCWWIFMHRSRNIWPLHNKFFVLVQRVNLPLPIWPMLWSTSSVCLCISKFKHPLVKNKKDINWPIRWRYQVKGSRPPLCLAPITLKLYYCPWTESLMCFLSY